MQTFDADIQLPGGGRRIVRVQAAGAEDAARVLGVSPAKLLSLRPVRQAVSLQGRARLDLRLFSQELALLLRAGIPLLEALQTLQERDGDRGDRTRLDSVIEALQQGLPLSQALARQGGSFDELFIAIVSASERSGQVATALEQHAAYLTWAQQLRAKLVAAAIYPALLMGAGLSVVAFLLLYVLPRFAPVFDGMGNRVPAASRALISLGVSVAAHPGWVAAAVLGTLAALVLASRSAAAQQALWRALWRAPVLGARWRVVVLARLYRGLALLLGAGVPVPAALRLLKDSVPGPLQSALADAASAVSGGLRLSQALHAQGLATPVARRMAVVGEGSGELGLMLERAAQFHDEEISRLSELVVRAVNPVLMLVMGLVIGGIVVLMYLPIFTLMEQVQ
jgi:general secretion pathway protein F